MKGTGIVNLFLTLISNYFTLITFGFLCSGTICSNSISSKPFFSFASLISISSASVNFLVKALFAIPLWIKSSLGLSTETVFLDLISRTPSVKITSISSPQWKKSWFYHYIEPNLFKYGLQNFWDILTNPKRF